MANRFAREGLSTAEMGQLSKAFQNAEGSAEQRWAEAKSLFPQCSNLDEGFKAWCFKVNGVPLPAPAAPPAKKTIDPLK